MGFDKGVVADLWLSGRVPYGITRMNGEWPGQDPFDVLGGLFAEAHRQPIEIFEAEMVLLCSGFCPS